MKGISLVGVSSKRANGLKKAFERQGVELEIVSYRTLNKKLKNGELTRPLSQYWDFCVVDFFDTTQYIRTCKILTDDGIRLFNTVSATQICRDKFITYQTFLKFNIPQMETYGTYEEAIEAGLMDNSRVVVKERTGMQGRNVFLCKNDDDVQSAIAKIRKHRGNYVIQAFCETTKNRAVRVVCINGKHIGSYIKVAKDGDFRVNISQGATGIKEVAPAEFIRVAEKCANIAGTDLCAVDLMFGENDSPIVCEINSMPGFRGGLDEVFGIDPEELWVKYIIEQSSKIKK